MNAYRKASSFGREKGPKADNSSIVKNQITESKKYWSLAPPHKQVDPIQITDNKIGPYFLQAIFCCHCRQCPGNREEKRCPRILILGKIFPSFQVSGIYSGLFQFIPDIPGFFKGNYMDQNTHVLKSKY